LSSLLFFSPSISIFHAHLAGITVKLQKRALDIVEAYEQIKEVSEMCRNEWQNTDSGFGRIYDHAMRNADKIGTTAVMPRIASRQKHCSNTEAANPLEYITSEMWQFHFLITSLHL